MQVQNKTGLLRSTTRRETANFSTTTECDGDKPMTIQQCMCGHIHSSKQTHCSSGVREQLTFYGLNNNMLQCNKAVDTKRNALFLLFQCSVCSTNHQRFTSAGSTTQQHQPPSWQNDDKPFSSLALVSFCAAQQIFLSEAFLYHVQPHSALLLTELSTVLFLLICLPQLPKGKKKKFVNTFTQQQAN